MMKLAVIGCGNMASAIVGGLIGKGIVEGREIIASDKLAEAREKMSRTFGTAVTEDNRTCVREADIVLFAVKPGAFPGIAHEIKEAVRGKLLLSIMAGKSIKELEDLLGADQKIVRAMPNTPALVGAGITGYCSNGKVSSKEMEQVKIILEAFSEAEQVPESLMGVVTSLSGSSPAYVYMFIEAMADAAVADGMPRNQAYHFAAQTVLGSAKMVLETGRHPGELKDMVCSPAGTTIEGVTKLEEKGFRTAVIEAVRSCTRKALNM